MNIPKILDGKYYNNIKPNNKTPSGIVATCTKCWAVISGTTKSTGNFLSHIKRRHKDILIDCQQYCHAQSTKHSDTNENFNKNSSVGLSLPLNCLMNYY